MWDSGKPSRAANSDVAPCSMNMQLSQGSSANENLVEGYSFHLLLCSSVVLACWAEPDGLPATCWPQSHSAWQLCACGGHSTGSWFDKTLAVRKVAEKEKQYEDFIEKAFCVRRKSGSVKWQKLLEFQTKRQHLNTRWCVHTEQVIWSLCQRSLSL